VSLNYCQDVVALIFGGCSSWSLAFIEYEYQQNGVEASKFSSFFCFGSSVDGV
jgi:hypothetical protein